jgi:hypothetical protein
MKMPSVYCCFNACLLVTVKVLPWITVFALIVPCTQQDGESKSPCLSHRERKRGAILSSCVASSAVDTQHHVWKTELNASHTWGQVQYMQGLLKSRLAKHTGKSQKHMWIDLCLKYSSLLTTYLT